jgi:hypothetical protein
MASSLFPDTRHVLVTDNMVSPDLQAVAIAVLNRARRQGYVLPREIRGELKEAGHSEGIWKQVVNLIRPSLKYHHGRYYAKVSTLSPLEREKHHLRHIRTTLHIFLQKQKGKTMEEERRKEDRNSLVCALKIRTESGQELTVLGQDLSSSGFRVITDRSLLGKKIFMFLPPPQEGGALPVVIAARVLWCVEIADGLFKNGGSFLELISPEVS